MLDEDAEDARRRRQRQKKQENNQADETNFVRELMGNMGGWNVAGMETPKKILNKLKHETQKQIRLIGSVLMKLQAFIILKISCWISKLASHLIFKEKVFTY